MPNCKLQRCLLPLPCQKPRMLHFPFPSPQRNLQRFSHDTCSPIARLRL
jgi:hypothetical protein